jgi:hypothetical protein
MGSPPEDGDPYVTAGVTWRVAAQHLPVRQPLGCDSQDGCLVASYLTMSEALRIAAGLFRSGGPTSCYA